MKRVSLLVILVVFAACRHEKATSNRVYTAPAPTNCGDPIGQVLMEGNYQGKNIYVQNPYAYCTDTTIKFCTASVTINDTISIPKDSLASSAFEIPLTDYGFQKGDQVRIVIKHYPDCKPKVLNPEVR